MERVTEGTRKDHRNVAAAGRGSAASRGSDGPEPAEEEHEGERRRPGEPLRAAWRPEGTRTRHASTKSGLRRFTAAFGWRAYLVPILLVVTALVVFDTTRGSGASDNGSPDAASSGGNGADEEQRAPVATEVPASPVDLDIPTAELPDGGDYTESGEGSWHVVPLAEGSGEQAGETGEVWTYTVEVEDGLDPGSYTGDDSFAASVEAILASERSWVGTGDVAMKRVDGSHPAPRFRVSLTSPETTGELCGTAIPFESSCYKSTTPDGPRVVINLARWVRGAKAFGGDDTGYRQYVINHEVGHALGNNHVGCREDAELAPVMMQQTFGVANDYVAKLNDMPGGDVGAVPADGKVCKPNAWPNPQPDGD
ncbi:hypothetical protein B1813_17740 [Saccharomonospora piscinae]|uniref:Peptidase metallopeptidase domain-containing protein n=1 Tax=Saccharomonospora piscinae TaxID=687388 RepID=A0A1V8ZZQ2_SACPI|nr:DUF3152 domain-containing protein [Saccharomonospora piscinae]OQO90271.1 hypothetical protein B1813_17740 [Saccharomonospora piscinae]TLW89684.1 DUF3152 domain-containing protein [Saccharomonospora piscinae]